VSVTHAYAVTHSAADGDRGKRRALLALLSVMLSQQRQQTLGIIGSAAYWLAIE